MAFEPENLRPLFTDWPARPEAIWTYEVPPGDTIEMMSAGGYFDAADHRLCSRSIVIFNLPDADGDGIAEAGILFVLSRDSKSRVAVAPRVSDGERIVNEKASRR